MKTIKLFFHQSETKSDLRSFELRRKFVLSGSALGVLGLSGCQTMATLKESVLSKIDLVKSASSDRPFDGTASDSSGLSKSIFDTIDSGSPVNVAGVNAQFGDVQLAFGAYEKAKQSFLSGKSTGGMKDIESVVSTLAPSFIGVSRALLAAVAKEQKKALNIKNTQKPVRKGSVVTIPSGYVLGYTQKGNCMDSSLPAPVKGDALQITRVSSRVPEPLIPLFKSVGQWAENPKNKDAAQHITWAIMEAGSDSRWAKNAASNQAVLDQMNQVLPGAADTFINYHNGQLATKELVGRLLKKTNLEKFVSADQLLGHQPLGSAINSHLSELIRQGEAMADGKGTGYSMLTPYVAARAIGNSVLSPQIEIANLSGKDFNLDLLDWYAKPVARKQSVSGTTIVDSMRDHALLVNDPADVPGVMKLISDFTSDVSKFGIDNALGSLASKSPAAARAIGRGAANAVKASGMASGIDKPIVKLATSLLTATPILGNVLSLYEAGSGKDWFTGEPLSIMERGFSFLGGIPGANVLRSVAAASKIGSGTQRVAGRLSNNNVFKFIDNKYVDSLASLNGWIWSDSAAQVVNNIANGSSVDNALQWNQNAKKSASDFLILTRNTLPWQKPVKDYLQSFADSGNILPGI